MSIDTKLKGWKRSRCAEFHSNKKEVYRKRQMLKAVWRSLPARFKERHQYLGQLATIGCVALEITQRCNLNCTVCYLSQNSKCIRNDIPLNELKHRLEQIYQDFGIDTNVQITGGEPTLRKCDELVKIIRYAARLGLEPCLVTNGILASRRLLRCLRRAGLKGVLFHVDITQQRKGYKTEKELNCVREEYVERVRGLGLSTFFSITICDENLIEIPELVHFL